MAPRPRRAGVLSASPLLRTPVAFLVFGVVGAAACDDLEERVDTVDEAAELLLEGGTRELRDPLRPLTPGPRVLVVALDGVGYDALEEAVRSGRLSAVTARLGAPAAPAPTVHPMTTVLPSITLAAWTTLFTGEPPAVTGVPGNEWFDREVGAFRAPAPASVSAQSDALALLTDGALGEWSPTPTLFERAGVRAHVSFLPVHRGADLLTMPNVEDILDLLGAGIEGLADEDAVARETYQEFDQASVEEAVDALEDHGVPRLQVVYFPGVDLYTHVAEDPLAEQQRYLEEVVDPTLETLVDAYEEAGAWAGTWVVLVSDHGHTPVPSDDAHAVGSDDPVADVLERAGWRVRPGELGVEGQAFQAVVAYQGAFAYVYLTDRSACAAPEAECDWTRRASHATTDSVAEALWRHYGERAGPAAIEAVLLPRRGPSGELLRVDAWTASGRTPGAAGAVPEGADHRLDQRLGWLLDGPLGHRAGDLILVARSGAWAPLDERFYFSSPYRSWHGSAHPQDSRVGLVVERVGGGDAPLGADLTQLDFTPLILRLLQGDGAGAGSP